MSEPSNIRINPFVGDGGTTTYINLTETHIIPSVSPYVIRLNEVPEKQDPSNIRAVWVDSSTGAVTASALTEVAATPAAGEFRPDYSTKADGNDNWNTGLIEFSAVDAGKIVQISYTGMGTLAAVQSNKYPSWYTDRGDGSDGDFIPEADCTIGGVKNYKRVFIKAGVTISVNQQLVIKATGSVVIAGTINGNGSPGVNGKGGAGSAMGGDGGWDYLDTSGDETYQYKKAAYAGGAGTGGGNGGAGGKGSNNGAPAGGAGGVSLNSVSFYAGNGSGGGGGMTNNQSGVGGGGGGGYGITVIAAEVTINGSVTANGGAGESRTNFYEPGGGGGGGGNISIVADVVIKSDNVTANGGSGGTAGKRATAGADGEAGTILIKQLGAL
nr:MAG TPA: hypothetical protein [Caudoviricetes sp.]